ncbi:MAG: hypothetical protein NZZ60_06595 [Bacteroidia bacterium]|nr:hypothetical protein [Bacteroidia bacterium]MCX7651871.1 hypothetical protein [Bacteroidia bacterium]MDW8415979.1 hypothetical protein [Bacteroidia bacterium]
MITLFACPKPFTEPRIAEVQRKAIQSWLLLKKVSEIILIGDDELVAEVAAEYNLKHIPYLEKTAHGSPMVSDLFYKAKNAAISDILMYVNSDILLTNKVIDAVDIVKQAFNKYLIIISPYLTDINGLTIQEGYENRAFEHIVNQPIPTGADVFIFPKTIYDEIPPFGLGRCFWDFWLISDPLLKGIPVIDATDFAPTFHPVDESSTHYVEYTQREAPVLAEKSISARSQAFNMQMNINFTLTDSAHLLRRHDVPYKLSSEGQIIQQKSMWRIRMKQKIGLWMDKTAPIRRRIGLYRWWK